MQIKKIYLETSKLAEVIFFYREVLQLPVATVDEADAVIYSGDSEIHFRSVHPVYTPFYHFAFNIPFNKVEAARDWLNKKVNLLFIDDYQSEIAEFINWNARSLYFFDPAGNIVEFIGRKDYRLQSPGGFGPQDILSVSEIGIVFAKENYDENLAALIHSMDLPVFSKQKSLPGFSALGDDEGLFIVVIEQRNWYPTQIPSSIFPLKIEVVSGGKIYSRQIS